MGGRWPRKSPSSVMGAPDLLGEPGQATPSLDLGISDRRLRAGLFTGGSLAPILYDSPPLDKGFHFTSII